MMLENKIFMVSFLLIKINTGFQKGFCPKEMVTGWT